MKKVIILTLFLLALGGVGYILISGYSENNESVVSNQEVNQISSIELNEYTKLDVAVHNKKEDCWTIIEGKVYNITSYVPRHPGGNNILSACGTDGTAFFNGEQAGLSGGRNNHSGDGRAESELRKLQIGTVAD